VSHVKRQGYASSIGETEHNISAIAVPISAESLVAGSFNIFFSGSISPETAATRYVPK
jgi:IclR family mhp operon transcriptional activator